MNEALELLWKAARVGALAYAGLFLFVFLRQSAYVYIPSRAVVADPSAAGLAFENLALTTTDGETLGAWFVPAADASRRGLTLLYCHGNGGNIGHRVSAIETFHRLGLDVLIFDYRGYGISTGKPTEKGTYEDARSAWRYLVETRGVPASNVVIYGHSLGGAIAAKLAAETRVRALVLESAFSSARDMAKRMFPFLPGFICRFRYDTVRSVRETHCPVLVAHGPADEQIPFAQGRRIFAAANPPKRFAEIRGGHNDGGMETDENYRRVFIEFLDAR